MQFAWPWITGTLLLAWLLSKRFDVLLLGDEVAAGLGQNIVLSKTLGWMIAILLTSVTVSVVGPIGFVGIIAPHLVRLMGYRQHRSMIIGNIVVGAALLIGADIWIRFLSKTSELPVGAMTAIIGGPWLVYLAFKMGVTTRTKAGSLDGQVRIRSLSRLYVGMAVVVLCIMTISLSFGGTRFTPLIDLPHELMHNRYVFDFRVPRIIVSFVIGMMMAMSGVMIQNVLRNPLADSSVLGITSGANVMAMLFLLVFPQAAYIFVPIGALVGAFITMFVILMISRRSGYQPLILLLMGIAFSAVGAALIQIFIVKANLHASQALTWLAGSTYGTSWHHMWMVIVTFLLILPIVLYYALQIDVLTFGDEVATGVGVNTKKSRLYIIILVVILSAVSVSVVGAIGFIGLLAPHIARRLIGPRMLRLLPLTLCIGGILLLTADFLGRFILAPKEIPSGIIVSLLGAPYLLYLLKQTNAIRAK